MQVKVVREKARELESQEFEQIANTIVIGKINNIISDRAIGEMVRTYDVR